MMPGAILSVSLNRGAWSMTDSCQPSTGMHQFISGMKQDTYHGIGFSGDTAPNSIDKIRGI